MNYWLRLWLSRAQTMTGDPAERLPRRPRGVRVSPGLKLLTPTAPEQTRPALRLTCWARGRMGTGGSGSNVIKNSNTVTAGHSAGVGPLSTGAVGRPAAHRRLAWQGLPSRFQRGECRRCHTRRFLSLESPQRHSGSSQGRTNTCAERQPLRGCRHSGPCWSSVGIRKDC